jgi:hypothetical protein
MSADVYLAHSYSWVHGRLTDDPVLDEGVASLVDSSRAADLIVFPQPPRPDPDARDTLRSLGPRELLRTFVYSQLDDPFPWAPGIYVSLPAARSSNAYAGGFYVVHHHGGSSGLSEELDAAQAIDPDLLWSFMGTVSSHPVRRRLAAVGDERGLVEDTQAWSDRVRWGWESKYRSEGEAAFRRYASTVARSAFVVCPRGRGASSIRLFEAMQAGRCPVIVSDEWLPPPFVDWETCSIRVAERRISELPAIVREREGDAGPLGRRARRAWEEYFAPERQLATLISACLEIAEASPSRPGVLASAVLRANTARRGARAIRQRICKEAAPRPR